MRTLLITFGCSWTFGVGAGYQLGQTEAELRAHCYDRRLADTLSWRGQLCQRLGWSNLNFSSGGSSNQRQFRLAQETFNRRDTKDFLDQFDRVVVLWGITSTARNELYSLAHQSPYNFFYGRGEPLAEAFTECLVKHSYDHDYEVFSLVRHMLHWNNYFELLGIENYWFDSFNTHHYQDWMAHFRGWEESASIKRGEYTDLKGTDWPQFNDYAMGNWSAAPEIEDEIQRLWPDQARHVAVLDSPAKPIERVIDLDITPRDLLSRLALDAGYSTARPTGYFRSIWKEVNPTMDFLVAQGLCNPYSLHPTQLGHSRIADYFLSKIAINNQL
jgi:hypothetical protein